ncbi:MAG: hypothetical protein DRJ65_21035 [Acidobacteria bacterium]|nr:MAG: hypothetical protein DRJ65_21035 [Acidobacteriota bacterium]
MKNLDHELLIPHKRPALLVTGIKSHGSESIIVRGQIEKDHPLAVQESAPAVLAMEFAAQAAGLLLGLLRLNENPQAAPPKIGYLASLRAVRFETPTLPVDRPLTAEVILEGRLGSMALFSAKVMVDNEIAATGRFAIAGEQTQLNRQDAKSAKKFQK